MKYPEKILLKLPAGTLARIDAVSGNRSEFVRDALLSVLGGGDLQKVQIAGPKKTGAEKPVSENAGGSKKNFDRKPIEKDGLRPDEAVLLEAVRRKRMTSQQADRAMGWLGLRFARAESELLSRGLIRVDGGVLVAVDGACDELE